MSKKDTVINYIKEQINIKKWSPGFKIFSENQLVEYLSVSRLTVRLAIKDLINEGILEARRGSGTYVKTIVKQKKYIVILTRLDSYTGDSKYTFRNYIELLKKQIKEIGFTPILYIGDDNIQIKESLSVKFEEIAGVIFLNGLNKDLNYLINFLKAPIISTLGYEYIITPGVILNYQELIFKINSLIQKYNFKNIIIFTHFPRKKNYLYYAIDSVFHNFKVIHTTLSYKNLMNSDDFNKTIKSLKQAPDCIVFMDDTIYLSAFPYFQKYQSILKNTKFITHSSGYIKTIDEYKTCLIEFDLKEVARKTVDLINNRINKVEFNEYNILINPKVINEDNLK
ncbi:MAG: GntR family transcriptional regulator [Abditibacteriota bacterium]|nr:GntR family transcriptional regulator [Abditibacteriota bacterium]